MDLKKDIFENLSINEFRMMVIEEMSNINVETEDSETQLDKPKISIKKDNTEFSIESFRIFSFNCCLTD